MTETVLHILNSIQDGGVEDAMNLLLNEGFYVGRNVRFVEMEHGHGVTRDKMVELLGNDRLITINDLNAPVTRQNRQLPKIIKSFRQAAGIVTQIRKLCKAIRENKPDTIILSGSYIHVLGRTAAMFFPDVKVVTFEHMGKTSNLAERFLLKLTSWRSNKTWGDAQQTIEARIPGHYLKRPSTQVVPLVMFDPCEIEPIKEQPVYEFSVAGRLSPEKNYVALVHAIALLDQKKYPIRLTIAGEGPEHAKIVAAIAHYDKTKPELKLSERITLAGWLSGATLNTLYRTTHGFAMPSLEEGFGMAAAKAMAKGRPVLCTNFCGAQEYGRKDGDGQNMIIIADKSPEAIAAGLMELVGKYKTLAPKIAQNAYDTMQNMYGRDVVKSQWQTVWNDLDATQKPSIPNFIRIISSTFKTQSAKLWK